MYTVKRNGVDGLYYYTVGEKPIYLLNSSSNKLFSVFEQIYVWDKNNHDNNMTCIY
jgi:hypothetical protein